MPPPGVGDRGTRVIGTGAGEVDGPGASPAWAPPAPGAVPEGPGGACVRRPGLARRLGRPGPPGWPRSSAVRTPASPQAGSSSAPTQTKLTSGLVLNFSTGRESAPTAGGPNPRWPPRGARTPVSGGRSLPSTLITLEEGRASGSFSSRASRRRRSPKLMVCMCLSGKAGRIMALHLAGSSGPSHSQRQNIPPKAKSADPAEPACHQMKESTTSRSNQTLRDFASRISSFT
jgi:hypothetical protein